jgi:hypothetical protein
MQGNILKLSFLMSYITMLICVVSGIPFMTALFRSIILMAIFSLVGFLMRWYFLKVVTSVELERMEKFEEMGPEEESFKEEETSQPSVAENVEQNNLT